MIESGFIIKIWMEIFKEGRLTSNRFHRPRSSIWCWCSWSRGRRFRRAAKSCPTKPLGSAHCLSFCIRRSSTGTAPSHSSWTIGSGLSASRMSGSRDPSFHAPNCNQVHSCCRGRENGRTVLIMHVGLADARSDLHQHFHCVYVGGGAVVLEHRRQEAAEC